MTAQPGITRPRFIRFSRIIEQFLIKSGQSASRTCVSHLPSNVLNISEKTNQRQSIQAKQCHKKTDCLSLLEFYNPPYFGEFISNIIDQTAEHFGLDLLLHTELERVNIEVSKGQSKNADASGQFNFICTLRAIISRLFPDSTIYLIVPGAVAFIYRKELEHKSNEWVSLWEMSKNKESGFFFQIYIVENSGFTI